MVGSRDIPHNDPLLAEATLWACDTMNNLAILQIPATDMEMVRDDTDTDTKDKLDFSEQPEGVKNN